jgi:small subunit ribosomal protein S15
LTYQKRTLLSPAILHFEAVFLLITLLKRIDMSINKEEKASIMKDFGRSEVDTGSVEVQCAVLTERIKSMTEHLKTHKKDYSSRNSLLVLVARRKRLLKYLKASANDRYLELIERLGLKSV